MTIFVLPYRQTIMDKQLVIYPISTGDELNVFSTEHIRGIRIMDMSGNVLIGKENFKGRQNTVDIKQLPGATYIVEVMFTDSRVTRSVFVKL